MKKQQPVIELPNLDDYKQAFAAAGVTALPNAPFSSTGLIADLPAPPAGKTGWPWTVETQPPTKPEGFRWPKISIVTPSYNQGHFIEQTIRSVLLQNYPNLEYVICDGGSNDATVQILEKYSPWLSFWQSKKDRGFGHAINLGFSLCNGDYSGWINSDDFYLPDCFQMVAARAQQSPDFIYGDAISLYDNDRQTCYWQGNLVLDHYLPFGGLISSHAAFWRSNIHAPIWEKLNCAVDYELWLRILPGTSKSHLPVPLGVFRVQPQSKSCHARYQSLWQEDMEKLVQVYGLPPKPRSRLYYEFKLVQKIYKSITRLRNSNNDIKFCS